MAYIIENAYILKRGELKNNSLLVDNNKISSIGSSFSFKRYKHLRMNANDYIMAPTHILLDNDLPLTQSFVEKKQYYLNQFIFKGCTTILTSAHIKKEKDLTSQLKRMQTALLDSPVDYVLGARIPLALLTPSFLRLCKREKVPAIFVEVNCSSELTKIPWGWIKEAMFPYNSPLIPMFLNKDDKKSPELWVEVMSELRIPSLTTEIQEGVPLTTGAMEKIGIFPKKSNLHHGGEVSYNFYLKDRETVKMVESELFIKHDSSLLMTIHKGKVIRAGEYLNYRPGYGEYVLINKPAFYLSPT